MKKFIYGWVVCLVLGQVAIAEPQSFYDFKVKSLSGEKVDLKQYKGKVLLVVNTASQCGYTPQYKGLQAIYQKYQGKGFEVLGFPSNDFGKQEPGSSADIKKFCELKYKVTFPMFEKNSVSSKEKQPLYSWLIANEPEHEKSPSEVKWNFEKFLISKTGKVIARFRSGTTPESDEIKTAIDKELQ